MSSRSTTRASSPSATAPSDTLVARLLALCALFLAPCSALVTSRLVTFSARSGLPAQRSWLYPGFDSCFSWSSYSIMCEAAGAVRTALVAVLASSGRRPTALRPIALQWRPSLRVGECRRLLARRRPGVCLSKAKVSGRVDVYTRGLQGSDC